MVAIIAREADDFSAAPHTAGADDPAANDYLASHSYNNLTNQHILEPSMHAMSVAEAKAHLSEILSQVESGDEVIITRRGRPIARLVPERADAIAGAPFDFEVLKQFVDGQPESPQNGVLAMRESEAW